LESWDFAGEVSREMDAQQADAIARGVKGADKALTSSEIGWVTAASDSETSIDFGYYDTDLWLTDPQYEEGKVIAGTFLGSATWGWWKGTGDTSSVGDKDGYCDPLEFWKIGYDFCTNLDRFWGESDCSYHPQHTNDNVLKSVELGWAGDEEPGGVRFAPIPAQIATVGETLSYTLVATNTDGSTGAITYRVASASAPYTSYSLDGANFRFTPPADGTYSFSFLATNSTAKTFGKASMTVDASLAAPTGLANSGITATSFTANWGAVSGAGSYLLDVASSAFGAKAAAKADDALLSENFDAFSGTSADRSSNLDEYLTGSGWTGSKVFENGGSAKLGSGNYNGWIATPELDLSSGGTVSFLLTQYGANGDGNTVSVSILSNGDETNIGTATPGAAETVEFAIPAASAATSVKIATSAKRAIIDDLVVTGGSAADVLAGQEVAGTSFTVDGLNTGTYYWRVRAVGNAKGPFSETMDVDLVADPSAPPSIRVIDDIEIEVGETATAQVKVSAPDEVPVTSLSITDGDAAATLEDGVFSFAPVAPGTYDFTLTAVNANGPATESFAVIASLADPETPETPSDVTSESFTAVWEGVPGAASYELVVIEGQGGPSGGGGGGGSGEILTETFADATYSTAGSGYANQSIGGKLGTWTATQCRGDHGNPTVGGTGTLTSPEIADGVSAVEFDYSWPFSETTSCDIDLYVGGNKVASATVAGGTDGTATYSFDAVSGATGIEFANAHATAKKMRIRFDEIRITTAGAKSIAKAAGDGVFSNNVGNVTSYEVTGLQSSTEYTFAFRAIAENGETTDWSAPVTVKTDDGPSAPAWSAIPAQHAYVGATFQLDLSGYLSGSPTPTVTADVGTVTGLHYVYEPDAVGPLTVTLTAVNDSGTDTVSFSLAVDEPPVGGNHYAVIVGCNKYDSEYIDSGSWLNGCVPDANHVQALVTSRGQWDAANVAKLTDSAAKHSAVLSAIASAASKAVPGDTFLYFHSSHGGNYTYTFVTNTALYTDWPIMVYSVDPEGVDNCICTYDADFTAAELASALAAFDPAVNIVVMIDACHSAGMFQYDGSPVSQRAIRRNAAGKDQFFLAELLHRSHRAVAEDVHYGCLEGSRHVLLPDGLSGHLRVVDQVQHRGFHAAEAEIVGIIVHLAAGDGIGFGIAVSCRLF
ncbi:MAG: fibronectin type III domain-containing protein, partial [Kiritimatiellae bacterium]|nr:fibronectin type III domain-containing protein [Kiritimatiellia bacterium]